MSKRTRGLTILVASIVLWFALSAVVVFAESMPLRIVAAVLAPLTITSAIWGGRMAADSTRAQAEGQPRPE
jgi:hypothetical protein